MDNALWWFGAVHAVAYAVGGAVILLTLGTVKLHMLFRVMSQIIMWHYARARWRDRKEQGFNEPQPSPYSPLPRKE